MEKVTSGEFDAVAVSQRVMETTATDGTLLRKEIRMLCSSQGRPDCCFTPKKDLESEIGSALLLVTSDDPVGNGGIGKRSMRPLRAW